VERPGLSSWNIAYLNASLVPNEENSNVDYLKEKGHSAGGLDPGPSQGWQELYTRAGQEIESCREDSVLPMGSSGDLIQKIPMHPQIV